MVGRQPNGAEKPLGPSRSPLRPHFPSLCHKSVFPRLPCSHVWHVTMGWMKVPSFRAWPRALPSQPSTPCSRLLAGCWCLPGRSGVPAVPGAEAHLSHCR